MQQAGCPDGCASLSDTTSQHQGCFHRIRCPGGDSTATVLHRRGLCRFGRVLLCQGWACLSQWHYLPDWAKHGTENIFPLTDVTICLQSTAPLIQLSRPTAGSAAKDQAPKPCHAKGVSPLRGVRAWACIYGTDSLAAPRRTAVAFLQDGAPCAIDNPEPPAMLYFTMRVCAFLQRQVMGSWPQRKRVSDACIVLVVEACSIPQLWPRAQRLALLSLL